MDAVTEQAPPVVAVVVVSPQATGFDEVVHALAAQDYPNLKHLFLLVGDTDDLVGVIQEQLPDAFIRAVDGNPGYGAAANEVIRLVEGENGFFLLMHDDVALDANAVRLLVEEMFRSNAGIVGPKLVDWSNPQVLQHVGLGVDRFGEIDALVEPGELDQEQHDAVRDVFCLPSACLLVRADLFKTLGGFEPTYEFYGDDLDLCWRAHLGGARVVVVPEARGRHREQLSERRPDLHHRVLAAQHRVRTVATLTGGVRLGVVLLQLLLITLVEMIVGVFTGHFTEAVASLRSLLGVIPRAFSIVRRRRNVAALRLVPYREVAGLQIRGSARFASYLRTREQRHMAVDHSAVGERRFTRNSAGQLAGWAAIGAVALVGSRSMLSNGVTTVGEFLRFPASPRQLLGDYWSGWWGHGLGSTTATPTGIALIGVAGVATLGHMGLLHTVAILGWLPIGYFGAWKLLSFFPSSCARIMGLLVYAAVPVPYEALGAGRWSVLAMYGAAPWIAHLFRRFAGIEPALLARSDEDVADAYIDVTIRDRLRFGAQLVLIAAVLIAFSPGAVLPIVGMALAFALAGLMARASFKSALLTVGAGVVSVIGGFVLNLPWHSGFIGQPEWDMVVGAPLRSAPNVGLREVLRFGSTASAGDLSLALWLPVLGAVLLARGWRLTWAARSAVLAVAGLALAVCAARQSLPFRLPELGLFLAPAAVGLALAGAGSMAAFEQDVQGGEFGWKQPLGLACGLAMVVGLVPGLIAAGSGRWSTPELTTEQLLQGFAADPVEGDSHTVFIGDPRVMPVPGWRFDSAGRSGVSFAIVDDGVLTAAEHWSGVLSSSERDVRNILQLIAANQTARGGRLLAPYAVRYIVIPRLDGVNSLLNRELPLPAGLTDALSAQLDLRPVYGPPNYLIFENVAWIPTRSILSPAAAAASDQAGAEALARTSLEGSTPVLVGATDRGPAIGEVPAGVLHVASSIDNRWTLEVNGATIRPRSTFGGTTGFDVPTAGTAKLSYVSATSRHIWVLVQAILWVVVALLASRFDPRGLVTRRRPSAGSDVQPLMAFGPIGPIGPTIQTGVETRVDDDLDDWDDSIESSPS